MNAESSRFGPLSRFTSIVLKEFFVVSGSLQMHFFRGSEIDQNPVGFNMDVMVSCPIQFQWMVFELRWQGLAGKQEAQ